MNNNFDRDFERGQNMFKWFFRGIFAFILLCFLALITAYCVMGSYVYSGKAKTDINHEVRDLSRSWHDTD